jgi:site-specific DNA-methyltransferase (cytosine-N4-specific)
VSLYYSDESVTLHHGDALTVLSSLPDASVNCCVTSPPYFGLRDYGVEGQLGLEASPAEYVENLRALFAQVRRVLADDGTLWLNLGDSFARNPAKGSSGTMNGRNVPRMGYPDKSKVGSSDGYVGRGDRPGSRAGGMPEKNLLGIPWRVAFALQDDGWILRNDIIWAKPNGMPESIADRVSTKHEHVFMFVKSPRYWFDLDPIREPNITADRKGARTSYPAGSASGSIGADGVTPHHREGGAGLPLNLAGRNPGDVWSIPTQPFSAAHFAVMPSALAERAIQAGCKPGGTVLDPFSGSGTSGLAAARHGLRYVGIDLNAEYLDLSLRTRLAQPGLNFDAKEAI